ncbi:MAG: hypothetical protein LBC65_05595 [Oscillospiraceae bacterium]|jgi:two-component system phosphate regulon sensor histidine kinase PhoR|nr:hypothetical protein [Oscillospiraceae bacterium]
MARRITLTAAALIAAAIAATAAIVCAIVKSVTLQTVLVLILPLSALCAVLSALARLSANRIVRPLSAPELDSTLSRPYDELAPLLSRIADQRRRIADQLDDLRRRSASIDAIMDNMEEGLVLIDHGGAIAAINRSALAILATPRPDVGASILELVRDIEILECVRHSLSGERRELMREYPGKTCRLIFSPAPERGAIILILDVTDRANAEQRRREFSANVSHELKTPLTGIYGYAEMLHGDLVKPGDVKFVSGKILDETRRLIALVEDVLLISRLDEGAVVRAFEPVDLLATAREVAESLALKALQSGVTVTVAESAVLAHADRAMMYELLYNLIDNAIKYNRAGGSVDVRAEHSGGRAIVSVRDTGIGIPQESRDRVFERFYRADKSRSKTVDGTGLGLAIVKHIVHTHNGSITLTSAVGVGTTATVTL